MNFVNLIYKWLIPILFISGYTLIFISVLCLGGDEDDERRSDL